jgi:hypothetical protein
MLRLADSSFEREALVSCKVRFRRGIGQLDAGEIKSADPKSANTKFAIPCAVFGAVFATFPGSDAPSKRPLTGANLGQ